MQDELAFMSRGLAIGPTMIQRLCLMGLKIHVSAVRLRPQPFPRKFAVSVGRNVGDQPAIF
jgi:hypothetical protein